MNKISKIILLLTIAFLSSCLKQSESIIPLAPIKTMAQLQREAMMETALKAAGNIDFTSASKASVEVNPIDPTLFYLNIKYKLNSIDAYDTFNLSNSFEQVGNSFLKTLAKIFLKIIGSKTIDIGVVEIPIPDLNLDLEVVKSIKVTRIFLTLDEKSGNFSFIKTLKIKNIAGQSLLDYNKINNKCQMNCLDFKILNGDIFEMIKNNQVIKIDPIITVSSFPTSDELILNGEIDLQIGLKLPF